MKSTGSQLDFLSVSKKREEDYLYVVRNGEPSKLSYSDLFDSKYYDTLMAVTYVSSPSFFSKVVNGYKDVEIILGIDNSDIASAFAKGTTDLINAKGADFFKEVDDDIKEKIVNNTVSIRYANLGTIIHSKLYLLSNSINGAKRVIIGSANFTESAFSKEVKQYEEVVVFDDNIYYDLYLSRFQAIKKDTVDFVPEKVKEKFKVEKAYYIDDEEKVEIMLEELSKKGGSIIIPDEIIDSISKTSSDNEKNNVEYEFTTKIISKVTRKKDSKLVLKSRAEIIKTKPVIKELLLQRSKISKDINRFSLYYNDYERRIDCQKFYDDGITKSISYCKEASIDDIRESLQLIERFINAYNIFTTNPDEDNLAKVYEVILYSFTSVFLFKIREDYGLEVGKPEKREDIPVFLIIGGRAKSGKSNLLSFVSRLISNHSCDDYLQYKNIDKAGVLEGLFNENNIFPILVDEMSEKFFNSTAKSKGEIFIKHIANSREGKHPALIATTNTSNFNVPEQVLRRIYYIQVDKTFDDNRRVDSDSYYFDVISKVNNTLFMDFCYRVCELIGSGYKIYKDSSDCLWIAREIFKDYYNEAGLEVPKYFPTGLFNDYKIRGKNMWMTLLNENKDIFRYDKENDLLIVTLTNIMNENEKQNYLNYIDVACIKEDMGLHTILHGTLFFDWINIKNPFVKKRKWFFG